MYVLVLSCWPPLCFTIEYGPFDTYEEALMELYNHGDVCGCGCGRYETIYTIATI